MLFQDSTNDRGITPIKDQDGVVFKVINESELRLAPANERRAAGESDARCELARDKRLNTGNEGQAQAEVWGKTTYHQRPLVDYRAQQSHQVFKAFFGQLIEDSQQKRGARFGIVGGESRRRQQWKCDINVARRFR